MSYSREIEEALYAAATVLETAEGTRAFINLVQQGDGEQSRRLSNLLEAEEEANRFFRDAEGDRRILAVEVGEELIESGDPGISAPSCDFGIDEIPGSRIGPYRLVSRIGEGGCGIVFLADQEEPVRRQVALKVIRLGMDTERVIELFERERQSVALMDHPNIARVLDAGSTSTGSPYFVMELVRGSRITDYCDTKKLTVRQRIDLFMDVCKAIHHAHQKGVIHCDIKPSNVLVSEDGGKPHPKVIDFGVAKAIQGENRVGTMATAHDHFEGTPVYMSPEQADHSSRDTDTRSDVYSLGILLYELLAGRTPFDPKELALAGVTETRRILAERDPATPSAMVASLEPMVLAGVASCRSCEPGRLSQLLKGDLDSVVMKSIEKDRHRRYETVNAFVMDLQRYLMHEPVQAQPQGRFYLFRKFVRRNRVTVTAGAGIFLSLLLGLGAASAFYVRERKSREEQYRLRKVAESAHASESQRLAEAREWEQFAQVSVYLSEGKTKEADELLRQTPLSSIKLNLRSSSVLRSLGSWNALRGRWQQATECYMMLIQVDDLEQADPLASTIDLAAVGPTLVEGGSPADYARFREWTIDRFKNDSQQATPHRVLKATLLTPVEPSLLDRFEPFARQLEAGDYNRTNMKGLEVEQALWRAFSLALFKYRQGEHKKALEWLDVASGYNPTRGYILSNIAPLRAMCLFQLGRPEEARAELQIAEKHLAKAFDPELPAAFEPMGKSQGYWWDWIIARILQREAESLGKRTAAQKR